MARDRMGSLKAAARRAGLTYVRDEQPGLTRHRAGRGFRYRTAAGRTLRDPRVRDRLKRLAIPPAWTSVWICADEQGHLQATGYDARGRKQYRYHADWRSCRDTTKYHHLQQFAAALPIIRRRVARGLRLQGLPREKLVAAAIRLLDLAGLRIGNEAYLAANGSFGLTTLQNRHATVRGITVRLRFRGKSGQAQEVDIEDGRLARVIRRCSELPGQRLFQYLDEQGEEHPIGSADVNDTLQEWTGADFTAKDFRTWVGSVSFVKAVLEDDTASLTALLARVAQTLGNTPAICRKHYIHPWLLEQFAEGQLRRRLRRRSTRSSLRGLDAAEQLTYGLLASSQIVPARKTVVQERRSTRRLPTARGG